MSGVFSYPFNSLGTPCAGWAQVYGMDANNPMMETGGKLTIVKRDMSTYTGCLALLPMAFDQSGFFVRVERVLTVPGGFTSLLIRDEPNSWRLSVNVSDGQLRFVENSSFIVGMATYQPETMAYWRLRADLLSTETVAEYSADAGRWTELGRTALHFSSSVYLLVDAGLGTTGSASGDSAVFSNLNVCPR
jgi:hypothetical protein